MSTRVARRDPNDPETAIQYKYRGIYEDSRFTPARLLFVLGRVITCLVSYSILARPSSPWSIFRLFPSAYPSLPPPEDDLQLPLINMPINTVSNALDIGPSSLVILLQLVLLSIQFTTYQLVWRREWQPMTGDGSSSTVTAAVTVIDIVHVLFYFYLSGRNPTWSIANVRWTVPFFIAGVGLQFWSDQVKHMFKEDPKMKGKVLDRGLWAVVRNPNYTGFHLWRFAQGIAVFGWLLGLASGYMFLRGTVEASIPSIERHMKKYGAQWEKYQRRTRYRMLPGIY